MGTPFLSEIRIFPYNFAPRTWAQCNGQLLPINQNQALFSLLGTTYGGNGQTTFALPDLRGRVSMHLGGGHSQGEVAGTASHTLTASEMPAHLHTPMAKNAEGTVGAPSGSVVLATPVAVKADQSKIPVNIYSVNAATDLAHHPSVISNAGGNQPHENRQPYLALNFCIALIGAFPSHN